MKNLYLCNMKRELILFSYRRGHLNLFLENNCSCADCKFLNRDPLFLISVKNKLEPKSNTIEKKENNKKQEVLDAIKFIKSKPKLSKEDKDTLYTLEMVLKNL